MADKYRVRLVDNCDMGYPNEGCIIAENIDKGCAKTIYNHYLKKMWETIDKYGVCGYDVCMDIWDDSSSFEDEAHWRDIIWFWSNVEYDKKQEWFERNGLDWYGYLARTEEW